FDQYLSYKNLFLSFLIYRLLNIFFNQTWFVADEYWQSQEVAHKLVFNYGYLTWEWKEGIRSYIYPLFIAVFYKLSQFCYLDNTKLLVYISPVIHSVLTAVGDFYFIIYAKKSFGQKIAYLSCLCRLLSWYSIYTSSRSLANNLEELFTIFSLNTLEYDTLRPNYTFFNIAGFFSFILRPTAAVNLVPIYCYQFFLLCNRHDLKIKFFLNFLIVGLITILFGIGIDSFYYEKFTISWWNFFIFNVQKNIGIHYGTHEFHWYFTQGYPTLLFLHLIIFAFGLKSFKILKFQLITILFNILFYSHKEFRFLGQVMPFTMIICAFGIQNINNFFGRNFAIKVAVVTGIGNVLLALFLGLLHQRAPITIMNYLRDSNLNETEKLLFLTPCHSTPFYSYLHKNISLNFLTCEPNLENLSDYKDQADRFYENTFK
ncbi:GPI mannosyltransferase 3 isoform X1, partial [Brachionus plicatilis]